MRISTQTLYAQGVTSMLDQQAAFSKVSEQLATGKRVVNPSDDPSAASQAVTSLRSCRRLLGRQSLLKAQRRQERQP